jgi:hypothetical protein
MAKFEVFQFAEFVPTHLSRHRLALLIDTSTLLRQKKVHRQDDGVYPTGFIPAKRAGTSLRLPRGKGKERMVFECAGPDSLRIPSDSTTSGFG